MKHEAIPSFSLDAAHTQRHSIGQSIAIGICSWLVVFVYGATLAVISLLLSMLIIDPGLFIGGVSSDELVHIQVITLWTVMMTTVIAVSFLLIRKRPYRFLRYARVPLLLGLLPVFLILGIGLSSLTSLINPHSTDMICAPLRDRLESSRSAVYPVQRDDGGSGTSFAISGDGLLVTNAHVIKGANRLTTWTYENDVLVEVPLTVQKIAADKDLALLKVDVQTPSYLRLYAQYHAGDDVYAIGFPGNAFDGGENTVSKGIISRIVTEEFNPELSGMEYLQTDAAINPGNSGGPLVSGCGLVGVNTIISDSRATEGLLREEGIGYAVSSKVVAETFNLPIQ